MIKYLLNSLILSLTCFTGLSQANYCRLLYKKKPVNYYRDWHNEYEYKVRAGVSKETIWHQELTSKDSVLEREIYYSKNGLPLADIQYAVPTREGVIAVDSFFYDHDNLLIKKNRRYLSCVLGNVFVTELYEYDPQHREIIKIEDGPGASYTETFYDGDKLIKRELYPNGQTDTVRIHYYTAGREDSMQVFRWRKWLYTTEFLYDSIKRTKEAYIRYANGKMLRSRFQFNPDGTVQSILIKDLPNWNSTRFLQVESRIVYNDNNTIKECTFFIKDKMVFLKKHFYEYY